MCPSFLEFVKNVGEGGSKFLFGNGALDWGVGGWIRITRFLSLSERESGLAVVKLWYVNQ